VACIYRPPGVVSRQFCDELADLLDQLVTAKQQFVICGDFNCPGTNGHQIDGCLVDVLQQYDAVQHVVDATRGDNTLDLMVTTSDDAAILTQVTVHPTCCSDHHLVTSRLHVSRDTPSIKSYQYRDLRRVDLPAFHEDIRRSPLYEFDVTMPVDDYVDLYNGEMQRLLDIHSSVWLGLPEQSTFPTPLLVKEIPEGPTHLA